MMPESASMEACCTKRRFARWGRTLVGSVCLALGAAGIAGPSPLGWAQQYTSGPQYTSAQPFTAAMPPLPSPAPAVNSAAVAADPVESYRDQGQFQGPLYVTKNFRVQAASPALAQAVGDRAEGYRELLAIQWLGEPLPDWPQACPIQVTLSHQAHGETSFLLPENGAGLPSDWEMKVFGPADRLLDSVLPHEITHTIFATYFKQRLPRWADEGACTTVEHPSEREKIQALLLRYLSPQQRQGIPFNRMFPMRDYPSDMLPLYAQGYSVAKFLIAQGGPRNFIAMIERGLLHERSLPITVAWDRAMRESYGYEDLSQLQLDWLQWVADGSQESMAIARADDRNPVQLASAEAPATTEPVSAAIDQESSASGSENFYLQTMRLTNPSATTQWAAGSAGEPVRSVQAVQPTAPAKVATSADLPAPQGQLRARSDSTILLPHRLR
jgi:hypothetical protein